MIEHVTDVQVLRAPRGRVLRVRSGQVWVTRRADLTDHVLSAGEGLTAAAGQCLYLEPWQRGAMVEVEWQPVARSTGLPWLAHSRRQAQRALAAGARRLARRLETLAGRIDVQGRCPA